MTVPVRTQYVTAKPGTNCDAGTNSVEYVTIHETANQSKGANAKAHANLQSGGNVRSASWHETCDDKEAVLSFPASVRCWHAGSRAGNHRSYGIEICVNSDGDFAKAVDHAAQRAAAVLKQRGLPISRLVQHNYWSGKNCPTFLRSGSKGITWADFVQKVSHYLSGGTPAPKPPTPAPTPSKLTVDGFIGPQSTRRWQEVSGTPVDGVITGQGRADEKYHVRLESVQYQGNGDSSLVRNMQTVLKQRGLYAGAIDGYLGPNTIRAWQKSQGLKADGFFGPASAEHLQRLLNEGRWI
ncbi:N-acetylmuramoyl-L-alanine amidase [Cellulosimicrobium phage DS1]|nr:N-acetylmuramoyl-L-alanine amidase [Cellulosimicrobium phage DS1]